MVFYFREATCLTEKGCPFCEKSHLIPYEVRIEKPSLVFPLCQECYLSGNQHVVACLRGVLARTMASGIACSTITNNGS